MMIALKPKPFAATLQNEPGVERSLIRPFVGLASFQKYMTPVCCSVSSRADVVCACATTGVAASATATRSERRCRVMVCSSLEVDAHRQPVDGPQPALVGVGVGEVEAECVVHVPGPAGAERQSALGVLLEQALPARAQREALAVRVLRTEVQAFRIVALVER